MRPYLRSVGSAVCVNVFVTPKASRSKLVGEHKARLKVAIAAAPADGAANRALVELFAKILGQRRSSIMIEKGHSSREKVLKIEGVTAEYVVDRLDAQLSSD